MPQDLTIVRMTDADLAGWIAMRRQLFPETTVAENERETRAWLARADCAVFGAHAPGGAWLGFLEAGPRDVAESCETSPVGYIEALWVDGRARRRGIARRLVEATMIWCAEQGYRELASDVELENLGSQAAHERLGFVETERLVTYRMDLREAVRRT